MLRSRTAITASLSTWVISGHRFFSPFGTVRGPEEYPETIRLLDTSLVVNDEQYSIFIQDMELMEYYVAAFRKVFDNLNELLD